MKSMKAAVVFAITAILVGGSTVLPAAAANLSVPGVVTGDWVNHDFTARDLQPVDNKIAVDTKFFGSIAITAGANNAGTVVDGDSKALMLEATTTAVNAFRGGINRTLRTGIEARVKFSSTDSTRSLFEVRSMTPASGTGSWPTLLTFDAAGKIKDWNGTVLRSYAANEWYDISIDLDSPNHRYSVWLNGSPLIRDLDLGTYVGVLQNKIVQSANAAKTPTRTYLASVRAGTITPSVQSLAIADAAKEKGTVYYPVATAVPVEAVASGYTFTSSDNAVAWPFGQAILARSAGTATITATETRSGVSTTFELTVTEPVHVGSARSIGRSHLNAALFSGVRAQSEWNVEQIVAAYPLVQTYMDMNEDAFVKAVRADSAGITVLNTASKFGVYARLFARLYEVTGDTAYAKRSLLIMHSYALDYPRIVNLKNYGDATASAAQPDITWAFGSMFDADVWGLLEPTIAADELKTLVQEVLVRGSAYVATDAVLSRPRMDNRDPYSARPAAVAASLLDDPLLMRRVVDVYDRLLSPDNYFADGFWHEETAAYSDQVRGNVTTTVDVIKAYSDPAGFTDTRLGLALDRTDLTPRWPLLTASADFASEQLIYPDGTTIPVNDADGKSGSPTPLPIVQKGLKNIELADTGYYGLHQGDTADATHIGIYAPKTNRWGSGHHHFNANRIDLWGGGVELLPYSGYVRGTTYPDGSGTNLRYPSMSPVWGNTPWVWRADGVNQTPGEQWVRPAVLAYDDGSANDKQVQVVETSVLGVAGKGADVNRRLEMLVNLGGNRNYTFDLARLKGGQAHEIYQRGAELEAMTVQTNGVTMTGTGQPNLAAYLTSINSTQGYPQHRNWFLDPMVGSGTNGFDFTWTGAESGSAVHTFMNGVPGSDLFMSQLPRTRVITTKSDETRLTAPQLTRRTILDAPGQVTQYGAVYEATASGQSGLVNEVDWLAPSDGDPMTTIARVHSGEYTDIVYVSDDTTERIVDGITFAGSIALARTDAQTGELLSSYVYGTGKVIADDYALIGADTERVKIIAATTSSTNLGLDPEVDRENTITVDGTFADPAALIGERILTAFGDGSGFSMKVLGVKEHAGDTVLTLESFTPFTLTGGGVETTFSPKVAIAGDAYALFARSVTGAPDRAAADVPVTTSPGSG
ncbi:hypothetical protein IFU40_03620 [Microbacterium sp. CFBP 13617]|uniref:hypothetical protein n=1 Tax=Microbacterium sp. CFBP 13617 TaxID=2774035 RepID=UPI0017824A78|nr:hypothetical protein [Microbacterium sp. CFBP 13617]MBD8217720.1 hypothetical protein [Microbacterium sp. CFBP 13617]